MLRRSLAPLVALAGLMALWLAAPAAAHGATLINPAPASSPVAAAGTGFLYSAYDSQSKRFQLTLWRSGASIKLPVKSRSVPFDVDTGPDVRGRMVAVYSRCKTDPQAVTGLSATPYYRSGSRCRLYVLDLASNHERHLRVDTTARGSDFLPSMWRGRLVWAHIDSRDQTIPTVLTREAGHQHSIRVGAPGDRAGERAAGPVNLDLRGSRLVATWSNFEAKAGCGFYGRQPFPVSQLWLYRFGEGRRQLLHAGCTSDGDRNIITWAGLGVGTLSYSIEREVEPNAASEIDTGSLSTPATSSMRRVVDTGGSGGYVASFATTGSALMFSYNGTPSGVYLDAPR